MACEDNIVKPTLYKIPDDYSYGYKKQVHWWKSFLISRHSWAEDQEEEGKTATVASYWSNPKPGRLIAC